MIQTQSQQWNQRNKQNNVNPCLKKILQFLLQCHPKVIIWYGLSESEGSVQWPQLELLCYKFSLKASRAHVVPNSPPPQHFTVAREEPEQQSRSSCQEWNEPKLLCEVEVGAFEYHRRILPPHPPSASLRSTRDGYFQCTHGKGGIHPTTH